MKDKETQPTMFFALWYVIKDWDISRNPNVRSYSGADGRDVHRIMEAIEPFFKDCQRKTLELWLPEKSTLKVVPNSYSDGAKHGWNSARSEILRRASEAGINIEGL